MARSVLSQVFGYVKAERKWWVLPVIAVLLVVGALLVFAHGSALAPFIYTIF